MEVINFNNNLYYNSKNMMESNPEFYYGCKTKPRTIIRKKNIPNSEYVYANIKAKEWNISTEECKKAQLLISKAWVDAHYVFKDAAVAPVLVNSIINPFFISNNQLVINKESEPENRTIVLEEVINNDNELCEDLPPLVFLNENEKFKDSNGNAVEIETRGDKTRNNIYFKVSDVSKVFEMPNLYKVVVDKTKNYKMPIHYKKFKTNVTNSDIANKHKTTFLTYKGILRVLFVSSSGIAEQFQDWAEDKLFTIQMGSKEAKVKLGTDILNISTKTYKAVFNTYANKFPCIYLLSLGKVAVLRETFGIDSTVNDESTVYKYGFTDDMSRRMGEHEYTYGKLQGVTLTMSTFHTIDVKYTSEAEKEIRDECNGFEKNLNTKGYNELIVLNDKEFIQMKKLYKRVGNECAGATLELQTQIIELKDKIKDMEYSHRNNLLEKDIIINKKQYEIETLHTKVETNQIIFNLEKSNYVLQLQLLSKK